jgi:hypothetical protein
MAAFETVRDKDMSVLSVGTDGIVNGIRYRKPGREVAKGRFKLEKF